MVVVGTLLPGEGDHLGARAEAQRAVALHQAHLHMAQKVLVKQRKDQIYSPGTMEVITHLSLSELVEDVAPAITSHRLGVVIDGRGVSSSQCFRLRK